MLASVLGFIRHRPILTCLVLFPVVLVPSAWWSMGRIDREGLQFFNTGKEIVQTLAQVARAVQKRDLAAVAARYSPAFQGSSLGLTRPEPADEREGVRTYRFPSAGPHEDRA